MKKSLLLLAAGMAAFLSTSAFADLLIYEPFDYTAGSAIIGQTDLYSPGSQTWERAGTAATSVHHVVSPSLTAPTGFPGSIGNGGVTIGGPTGGDFTEYARMSLGSTYGTSTTLYYSLLLNVPSVSGLTVPNSNLNANNDGLIAFNNGTGAGSRPSNWAGELVIRLGGAAGTYNLGIRASNTASGTTYWTGDLNPGDTHLVVVRYVQGTDASLGTDDSNDLWLDPGSLSFGVAEGSVPAPSGSSQGTINAASPANNYAASLLLGAGIAAGAAPSQSFLDEIRVGTTWADVTAIPVPEPSTFVLAGLGVLGLISWRRAHRG